MNDQCHEPEGEYFALQLSAPGGAAIMSGAGNYTMFVRIDDDDYLLKDRDYCLESRVLDETGAIAYPAHPKVHRPELTTEAAPTGPYVDHRITTDEDIKRTPDQRPATYGTGVHPPGRDSF